MKPGFLVDLNLPKYFSFFNTPEFIFVVDIDTRLSDSDIWKIALEKDLIILTRDVDFYSRAMVAKQIPKIVYFNLGNVTLNELYLYFSEHWNMIQKFLETNQLIIARREGIDILI